jgi:predicted patatin/cPLA2 family phospholipase
MPRDKWVKILGASVSIPMLFDPVHFGQSRYVDAGIATSNSNIGYSINRCIEKGYDPSQVSVDFMNTPSENQFLRTVRSIELKIMKVFQI